MENINNISIYKTIEYYNDFFDEDNLNIIYLSDEGWSMPNIGIWDACVKTGILTSDISNPIKIISDDVTLDGNGHKISNCDTGVYIQNQKNITIENVVLENYYTSIVMGNTHDSKIINNTINSQGGMFFNKCNNNIISDNYCYGDSFLLGINLFNCISNIIKFNSIISARDFGVILESSSSNKLYRNSFEECRITVLAETGKNNEIIHNNINKGNIGINALNNIDIVVRGNHIYELDSSIYLTECVNSYIYNNTCCNNLANGIAIKESDNSMLSGNTCKQNKVGIYFEKGSNNEILQSNLIYDNDVNIYVESIVSIK